MMIDSPTLVAFVLLNMSFALIPGPDVICILSNSVARGGRAGAQVCVGIATASLVHVAAAALGLSALLLAVPTAFVLVKSAGAIYLVWLGWKMLRETARPLPNPDHSQSTLRSPFVQGALCNLLNPKIAIFFLATLPQFVHPEHGNAGLQALLLGLASVASGTAVNLCTALLGARARAFFVSRAHLFQRFQQAAGLALVVLGLKVALERAR